MGRDPEKSSERPRRAAKRGRRSDESRRARLYLAELAWLEGYADGDAWRAIDTDELVALDGTRISKARRAARTVLREHPVALKELVGDVERWWQIVDAKLAWLSTRASGKPAAFDPAPFLTPRLQRVLRSSHLGEAAHRVAIAWLGEPDRVEATLAWFAAHETELVALADQPHVDDLPRLACVLARLALSGDGGKAAAAREAGVAALIDLLAIDAPDGGVALDVTRNAEGRLLGQHAKLAPVPPRSGAQLVPWVLRLAQRDTATRQRALALLGAVRLADALAPWQHWEREHAGLIARSYDLAVHEFESVERARGVGRLVNKLMAARNGAPPVFSLSDFGLDIDVVASEAYVRFFPSIVRLLSAISRSAPVHTRPRMFLHLARVAATSDPDEHVEWLWDALAAALEERPSLALLGPWHAALGKHPDSTWLDQPLVDGVRHRADIRRVVRLFAQRVEHTESYDRQLGCIATWAATGLADAVVLDLVDPLLEDAIVLDKPAARAVVALADGSARDVAFVAKAMHEVVEPLDYKPQCDVWAFAEYQASLGAGWLVRGALIAKQRARLAEAANLVMALPASRRPRLREPADTAWIRRYPVALSTALHRLAMVDPDAEKTAGKRLAEDLPDPADLRRELSALRARGATGSAAKRLANLEQRLASPKLPSAARLANLAERLETTARDVGLARLISEATRIGGERVLRAFGMPAWPAWAEPTDRTQAAALREILFALLDLEDADRELAGRLLRARSGPPPWDLRDDPANRRFLDRMRAAKLDPEPWLDPTPRVVRTATGDHVSLALADDPLEVFAMGRHFDTCLSPHGGNFFSVVANAADINKRVLYARRDGRVVGRCLFALTDGLAILTFNPYCHEAIDFPALVRDFAGDLAARIGTTVAARGPVSRLLSRDWYDDGSRDLVGRFGGLGDDFDFEVIPPDELVTRLPMLLGRALDDITLPVVLGHRGLRDRPRHLRALAPIILASEVSHTRLDATQLALDNDDIDLARRFLGDHVRAITFDEHGSPRGEILARLRPSQTLAALRRSRPRTVRRWSEDRAQRIALAGIALEALARPRKAAAMYRLAAKTETWIAESMRERLESLGEPVEGEVAD